MPSSSSSPEALFEPVSGITLDRYQARVVVAAIDSALAGSEFGQEAWLSIRKVLLSGQPNVPLDVWTRVVDLVDRACDDRLGPGLRVDLSLDRFYK